MAQRVKVTQVSDLDEGIEADETVRFSLDGTEYEIDLSADQAAGMRAAVLPFVEKARKVTRRRNGKGNGKKRHARPDLPDIREFARARGYEINERGRVPGRIIAEYDELKRLSPK